ncbi:MAG: VCBS repeat-containing protein, partial [Akkermansia sp.]|nr:VCBS repeat-containing protein [Akkermansia sp.]
MYTITVTNLNDSGIGSLRQAILDANSYTGADEIQIVFDATIEDACLVLESDIEIPAGVTLYLKEGVAIDVTHANFYIDGVVVADNAEVKDAFICTEVVNEDMYGAFEFHEILVSEGGKLVLNNANINLQPVLGDEIYSYSFFYDVYIESGGELVMNGGSVRLLQGGVCLAQGATASLSSLTECAYISNYGTLTLVDVSDLESLSGSKDSVLIARNVQINDRFHLKGDITADNVRCDSIQVYDSATCTLTQVNEGLIVTGDKKIYKYNFGGNVVEETMEYVESLNIKWSDTESPLSLDLGGVVSEDTVLTLLPDGGGYTCRGGVSLKPNVSLTLEEGVFLDFAYNYLSVDEGSLIIDWENEGDAIRIQSDYQEVSLRAGGSIYVRNANIIGDVYLMGGTFTMTGGALKAYSTSSDIDVCNNASATLSNVDVYVRVTTRNSNIRFTDCSLYNEIYMYSGEYITLNNCAVYGTVRSASPDFQIKGGNNTFYNDCLVDLHRFSGSTSGIASYFNGISGSIKAENPYIGLGYQMENCTFAKLPDLFRGGYRFTHDVSISSGYTVNLADGACWNMAEYNISSISGTLKASFSSPADALVSQQENGSVAMYRGGSIAFSKANIRLSGEGSCFRMVYEATLSMDHGVFEASTLQMVQGGTLNFDSMLVEAEVNLVSGSTASITNSVINGVLNISAASSVTLKGNDLSAAQISISDMADGSVIDLSGNYWGTSDMNEIIKKIDGYNAESVIISSVIPSPYVMEVTNLNTSGAGSFSSALAKVNSGAGNIISTIQVNDSLSGETLSLSSDLSCSTICVIEGNNLKINNYKLSSSSDIIIHDLTLPQIFLSDTAKLTAENLTLTAQEAIRLTNWSGNVDFTGVTATADAAYVGLTGTFGDTTLAALPASLSDGYKAVGNVSVESGTTCNLEDGVSLDLRGYNLSVQGSMMVENAVTADFLQNGAYVTIGKGGKLQLKNANLSIKNYVYMASGGIFEMEGGTLAPLTDVLVSYGGTANLYNVQVESHIYSSGSLSLDGCDLGNNDIIVNYCAEAFSLRNTKGIRRLSLDCQSPIGIISGNDFSSTTIILSNIPEGKIIDLSGNYWGTTDLNVIKDKIQGYDESRVLISTVLSVPNSQVFSFDSSMLGTHRISDKSDSLVLRFNSAVDADTVSADTIRLVDAQGNVLPVAGYEVVDNEVTMRLDSLPRGIYTVQVDEGLRDIRGNAFVGEEWGENVSFLSMEIEAPEVILFRSNSTVTDQFRYVDIFFDQDMDAATVTADNIHIYTESGVEVNISNILQSGIQGNVFFRAYFDEVSEPGTYRIVVDSEVKTTDGRCMDSDYVKAVYVSSPDLVVGDLIEVSDNYLGRYTTISYTVVNNGDGVAKGTWTDHIYLCRSEIWDENHAVYLASVEQNNQSVDIGSSYTSEVRALLDGMECGEYYIFVKTDMYSRLSEADEKNNISSTGSRILIEAEEVTMDTPISQTLESANQSIYYRLTAGNDGTIMLLLDKSVRNIEILDEEQKQALTPHIVRTGEETRVYFSAQQGGQYFVKIKTPGQGTYQGQISAADFEIFGLSIDTLTVGRQCSITLNGSDFTDGIDVFFEDSRGNRYTPEKITVEDSCTATVVITLPETADRSSLLTIHAQHPSGETITAPQKVKLQGFADTIEMAFRQNLRGERYTHRVGWVWKADLLVENTASYNVDNAIVFVTNDSEGFAMYYDYADATMGDRSALLLLSGCKDSSPVYMRSGEKDTLGVYVRHYRASEGATNAYVLSPDSQTEITDEQWVLFESALRPANAGDSAWNSWWSDMKLRIGNTEADFARFIYGMRDVVLASGKKVNNSSLSALTEIVMNQHPEYTPGYLVKGTVEDSRTGDKVSGVLVRVYREEDGQYIFVGQCESGSNGEYAILSDGPGKYVVSLGNAKLDIDGDGIVDNHIPNIELVEGDVTVNPKILSDLALQHSYVYANGNYDGLARIWCENGRIWYAELANNEWIETQLYEGANVSDLSLIWNNEKETYVASWLEHQEDGSAERFIQVIDSASQVYTAVSIEEESLKDIKKSQFILLDNGLFMLCKNVESDSPLYTYVDVDDDAYRVLRQSLDTEPLKGKSVYLPNYIKIPFIEDTIEFTVKVDNSLLDACHAKAVISGEADMTWIETNDFKLSHTFTASGTYYYGYDETKNRKVSESGTSFAYRIDGTCKDVVAKVLLAIPTPLTKAIGVAYEAIDGAMNAILNSDLKGDLVVNLSAEYVNNPLYTPYIQYTGTMGCTVGLGLFSDFASGSLTSNLSLNWRTTTDGHTYIPNSIGVSGSAELDVSFEFMGYAYGCKKTISEFNLGGNAVVFTPEKAQRKCITDSVELNDYVYTVMTDEDSGMSGVTIREYNKRTNKSKIIKLEGTGMGPLASGNGYISGLNCYSRNGILYIELRGYKDIHESDFETGKTLEELKELKYKYENNEITETVGYANGVFVNLKDSIVYGHLEDVSDSFDGSDGLTYRAEVCVEYGKKVLYLSRLTDSGWVRCDKVYESVNKLSLLWSRESNGSFRIGVLEHTALYDQKSTYEFVFNGSSWEKYTISDSCSAQVSSGSAGISGVIEDIINSLDWKLLEGCDDQPPPPPPPGATLPNDVIQSWDPNDFYGPSGYGAKGWIAPQEMQFQVVCENIPEENIAHAAIVRITQQIDDAFDYSTFRLGDMMMGGNFIEVEGDVQSFRKRLDWTATHGVWVDVNASFDADTGIVTWEFVAIDPETGFATADPFKGLLAPNYNPPEGDGGVYYYVTPKSTVETGTEFGGQASIVFDFNEAILTPTLSYTLDKDAPVAQVKALAESSSSRFLRVEWSGEDVGSGVDYYNVFVSVDGGDWSLWQGGIAAESALYTVAEGEHTYAFFAQGVDYVGNAEALGELVEAEAATVSTYSPQSCSLSVTGVSAGREGDTLTLRVGFNEAATCTDWAAALQLLAPTGAVDMSAGSFSYDEAMHTLTWVGSVAGVAPGEQLAVRLQDGTVSDAQGIALGDSRPAFSAAASLGAVGSAQAAPALVDYDGDGLLDLLVGEVASGKGRVRLYLNEGTAEVADFASFSYLTTAADTPLTVDAEGCQGAIVQLAELTGDAAAELVIGLADGTVRVFTAGEEGHWTDAGLLTCSVGGKEMTLDVGSRAAIEFVDFDGDGRTDLLVGEGDGHVVLYRDTAESGAASFDAGQYLHDSTGRIKVGSRASVVAADVDADGRVDLLLGSADGSILFYRNEGSAAEPLFATGVKLLSADKELDLSAETSRLRLDAADVNGDGLLDVVLGQSDGAVRVLYGSDGSSLLGVVQAGDNPLYAVENVQALAYGGQVRLSWDAVEGATYELSYKLAGDAVAQVLELEDAVAVLPLADGRYELSVRALTPEGTGPWSAPLAVLVDTVAPLSPESLQASAGENGSVSFSWAEADSATTYELRYKTVDSGSWQTLSCKATSVTLYNLPGGAYDWQVRAVDAAGNTSGWVSGAGFESTGAAAERVTWARGLSFDTTGKVTGGYYDIAKTGEGDSNLCWAAAAANILGWWQQQYPTGSALAGVPQDAAAIYACFCANWANKSGSESYAFTWWLADESDSASYMNYYYQNYQGSGELGGWYADYYNVANIGNHTAQVKLADMEAADVASEWNGIYRSGGMLALGVYRSYSSGSFAGGHSLTLWGFQEDAQGRITQIHVTDSDDEQSTLLTLDVELDTASGLYRIAGEQGNVSGYYLGSYTYLKAGGMTPDGSSPEQAESLGMSSARDGSGHYSGSTLNWVGTGDAVDFFSITAAGDGAYRVGVDAATLETTLRLSVGVLNGQGLFEVQQQMLLAPGAALAGLPGVQAGQGETLYVKVEALDTASAGTGGFYELNISGTVPAVGSGLATQDNSAEEAAESSADGSETRGWVGAGDACDFYRVEMAAAGSLSIGLDELEAAARVRVYEQRADGSLAQLDSRAVKAASGLDATLSLTSGTYFVEVASLDAGAGQYNTAYSLTLEK